MATFPPRHEHPLRKNGKVVFGKKLKPSERISAGDFYPSDDGTWRECDPAWYGMEARDIAPFGVIVKRWKKPT